ncbi:hypothetical protein FHG66_15820 [Rubellimicrobium rubrum]|uniref:Energy transducer TonB n=1 Tax=Rubellimicrobium rubrum TaxID=2585369 RepID=A0A5C4MSC7_9RHOB|nr:hypothetical protein FHG66_15820 [Rubellimicrobium rubrum]
MEEAAEPEPAPEPEPVEEPQDEAAPEEATTEIVTEAEEPSGAVEVASRPRPRPSRPAPQAEEPEAEESEVAAAEPVEDEPIEEAAEAEEAESEEPAEEVAEAEPTEEAVEEEVVAEAEEAEPVEEASADTASVDDALAAALADSGAGEAAEADPGPPMTGAEQDAFRVAVQQCWVVDPGSQAGRVSVTVAFQLSRDGRVAGDVELLTHNADSGEAANSAYESARRAILRCQGDGFPLPAEKYEQWRMVEMTFDPTQMAIR